MKIIVLKNEFNFSKSLLENLRNKMAKEASTVFIIVENLDEEAFNPKYIIWTKENHIRPNERQKAKI